MNFVLTIIYAMKIKCYFEEKGLSICGGYTRVLNKIFLIINCILNITELQQSRCLPTKQNRMAKGIHKAKLHIYRQQS